MKELLLCGAVIAFIGGLGLGVAYLLTYGFHRYDRRDNNASK